MLPLRLLSSLLLAVAVATSGFSGLVTASAAAPTQQVTDLVTYQVTITNLTGGQPFSPPVAVTHSADVQLFHVDAAASDALAAIAQSGNPMPMVELLNGLDSGVTDVVNVGRPLTPAGMTATIEGNEIVDSATFMIAAGPGEFLSLATMLICTNDGFTGLNSAVLPAGDAAVTYELNSYDAGREQNTEKSEDLVDPCTALGTVTLNRDPNGNRDEAVASDPIELIANHQGIQGGASLSVDAHGWDDPVATVTITRVGMMTEEMMDESMDDGAMMDESMDDGEMMDDAMDDGEMMDEAMDDGEMMDESMDDGAMMDESMDDGAMMDESMDDGEMMDESMDDGEMMDESMDDGEMMDDAMSTDTGLVTVQSSNSFSETVQLLQNALEAQGLTIMAVVDHTANAASAELDLLPTSLILVGNPNLGTPLMQSSRSIAIDLPQKFLVWEDENEHTFVTYNDPQYLADRHGIDDQDEVLNTITTALENFATTATDRGMMDDEMMGALATYEVTIENLATGQPVSPPVAATHANTLHLFAEGQIASDALAAIAQDGNPMPMVEMLRTMESGVTAVVNVGHPLTPANEAAIVGGNRISDSATFTITGAPGDHLSIVTMLICTNDGFTGIDAVTLPATGTMVFEADGYDAGREENTEVSADLVDPCTGLGPLMLMGDPNGNANAEVTTEPMAVIQLHNGIAGNADLSTEAHGWENPVLRITVTHLADEAMMDDEMMDDEMTDEAMMDEEMMDDEMMDDEMMDDEMMDDEMSDDE